MLEDGVYTLEIYFSDGDTIKDQFVISEKPPDAPISAEPPDDPCEVVFKDGELFRVFVLSCGEVIEQPENPVKEGYVFDGWRIGSVTGAYYDFAAPVTADITLYATWIPTQVTPTPYLGISLTPSGDKNFGVATYGYEAQPAHSVTVKNTGNQTAGALNIALSGTGAGDFILSKNVIRSMAVGDSDSFTVRPNAGLGAGTYTATITVSVGAEITLRSFTVSFTVNKAVPAELTWPAADALIYGEALFASMLSGGSTGGAWAWTNGAIIPTVVNSGYDVTFTPYDAANYDWAGVSLTQNVPVTVKPKLVTIAADNKFLITSAQRI